MMLGLNQTSNRFILIYTTLHHFFSDMTSNHFSSFLVFDHPTAIGAVAGTDIDTAELPTELENTDTTTLLTQAEVNMMTMTTPLTIAEVNLMTVSILKEELKKRNVKGLSRLNKEQMKAKLLEQSTEQEQE
jgi:hypothetical protein